MFSKMKKSLLTKVIKSQRGGSTLDYAAAIGGALILGIILYNVAGDTIKPKLESIVPSLVKGEPVEVATGDGNEGDNERDTGDDGSDTGGNIGEELEKGLEKRKDSSDSQMTPAVNKPGSVILEDESFRETVENNLVLLHNAGIMDSGMMLLKEGEGQLAGIALVGQEKAQILPHIERPFDSMDLHNQFPGMVAEIVEVRDFTKKNGKKRFIKVPVKWYPYPIYPYPIIVIPYPYPYPYPILVPINPIKPLPPYNPPVYGPPPFRPQPIKPIRPINPPVFRPPVEIPQPIKPIRPINPPVVRPPVERPILKPLPPVYGPPRKPKSPIFLPIEPKKPDDDTRHILPVIEK